MVICIFTGCHGHDDKLDAVLHGQQHLAAEIAAIKRILRTVVTKENKIMGTVEDGLTEVENAETAEEASLATLSADETRELADLTALQQSQGQLTDEQQARFDALTAKVQADDAAAQADDAAINAADPAPVTPPAE